MSITEGDPIAEELAARSDDLRADLIGLRHDMQSYHRSQQVAVQELQDEIETQRILSRFNRRTWFEVMAYIGFGSALFADAADHYARSGWWGLVLWTSQHGDGGPWEWTARGVGLGWEVAFVGWLTYRAQVPEFLLPRVAKGAPKPPPRR